MMQNGTKKIFENLAKDIMEMAETMNTSLPQSEAGKQNLALYNATNMQMLTTKFANAIVELAGETRDMTGCGNLYEASDWRDNISDELDERFLHRLQADAEKMETYEDANAEHRLGAWETLEAAE